MRSPISRVLPVARLDKTPFEAVIDGITHDGRGVAHLADGKAVFVAGALPGERVMATRTGRHRRFDEARTVEVLEAAPERVEPAPAEAEEEIAPETKAEEPAPETQQQQPAPARRGWWRRLAQ